MERYTFETNEYRYSVYLHVQYSLEINLFKDILE